MSTARICVIDLPSLDSMAWRAALADKAVASGWTYLELWGQSPPELADDTNYIILSDAASAQVLDPTAWVVLWGRPASALASLCSHGEHALWLASNRLAIGSEIARAGASVFASDSQCIQLPVIGEVRRAGPAFSTPPGGEVLAFYETLPPTAGAIARWSSDLFVRPDGRPASEPIDLTGRRRILAHAPFLELPPGVWRATLRVRIRSPRSSMRLRFEWGPGETVSWVECEEGVSGVYSVVLEATWHERTTARLVVWAQIPMFDGEIYIDGAEIEFVSQVD